MPPPPDQDAITQLVELSALDDGWLEGQGTAPDSQGITWLAEKLGTTHPGDLPSPHTCPTPEGGVYLEWTFDPGWRVSAEIMLPAHSCELQATHIPTGEAKHAELDLDQKSAWPTLYAFVRQLSS